MDQKQTVLFLCTGNACRSQMSEALMRHKYGDRFLAISAGTEPKGVHPLTIQVLEELGVSTDDLRSKSVKEFLGRLRIDHLVIVCQQAEDACPRMFPGMMQRHFWNLEDPPALVGTDEQRLAKCREVRDQISANIDRFVREFAPQSVTRSEQ